jgi:tripeptidyl-peptidase-1
MFLSQEQVARIDTAFQVLGARGVSIFMASGDGGSHFSFGPFSTLTALGRTLNKVSCEFQMPVAPTNSKYIIGVGGESWSSGDSSQPITWPRSGGGFSWQLEQPDHQKSVVAEYLQGPGMPPSTSFNANGVAYPDMAAVGVQGTSQSAPIAAGIWSMVIDHRLNAGLPPLGFVGPRMWQVAQQFPGEAFTDITVGNSATSCDNGFPATPGWDPNTGWGRPVWDGMLKHFGSDDALKIVV